MPLLFIYGTMLSRERNHKRLYEHRAIRLGDTYQTEDLFDMYLRSKNGAPCAVPPNYYGFPIEGELYAVDDQALDVIDGFEGHPRLYERAPVRLKGFSGVLVEMYHYRGLLLPDEQPVTPDPDYVHRFRGA